MGLNNAQDGKLLYHLTELKNMESIATHGLLSRTDLIRKGLRFEDVADHNILEGRESLGLEVYVPFHFHPYSAFDKAVQAKYPLETMIYICVLRSYAKEHEFKVLPYHPLSAGQDDVQLYDYDEGIRKIDWGIMTTVGCDAKNAKNIKMAECLSRRPIPLLDFQSIHVPNAKCQDEVREILENVEGFYNVPYVDVTPEWFN